MIKLLRIIGLLLSFTFLLFAAITFADNVKWLMHANTTMGHVLRLENNPNSVSYQPIVEFTDQNGRKVVFKENTGTDSKKLAPQAGDLVSVIYNSKVPQDARLNQFIEVWFLPIAFLTLGIFTGLISLIRIIKTKSGYSIKISLPLM